MDSNILPAVDMEMNDAPVDDNLPIGSNFSMDNDFAMDDGFPVDNNFPMHDNAPVDDNVPMDDNLPIEDDFPADPMDIALGGGISVHYTPEQWSPENIQSSAQERPQFLKYIYLINDNEYRNLETSLPTPHMLLCWKIIARLENDGMSPTDVVVDFYSNATFSREMIRAYGSRGGGGMPSLINLKEWADREVVRVARRRLERQAISANCGGRLPRTWVSLKGQDCTSDYVVAFLDPMLSALQDKKIELVRC